MTQPPNLISTPTSIHTIGHPPPYEPDELAGVRHYTASRVDEHRSLRWLSGLERLTLVGDLEPVTDLPRETPLRSLTLRDVASGGLGSLGSRPTLVDLVVEQSSLSRLDTLDDFPRLERLRIDRTLLVVGPTFGATLSDVAVIATPLRTLEPLSACRGLERLTVRSTSVSDLEPLIAWFENGGPVALAHMDLRYNPWNARSLERLGRLALLCDRRGIGLQISSEEATWACRMVAGTGQPIFVTDHLPDGTVELTRCGPCADDGMGECVRVSEQVLETLCTQSRRFTRPGELWSALEAHAVR